MFTANWAWADCSTVEVDTTHMGPVRNQTDTNWCVAFSLADLISFHTKQTASAIDVALNYNQFSALRLSEKAANTRGLLDLFKIPEYREILEDAGLRQDEAAAESNALVSLNGLDIKEGFNASREKGLCQEKDLPSSAKESLRKALYAIHALEINHVASYETCPNYTQRARELLGNLKASQIREILKKASPQTYMIDLRDQVCKSKIDVSAYRISSLKKNEYILGSRLVERINSSLDKQEPALIGYSSKMILPEEDEASGHASTVIGRRTNPKTGVCEYQVRNSWGNNVLNNQKSVKHENGNFWVSEKDLSKYVDEVDTLAKEN